MRGALASAPSLLLLSLLLAGCRGEPATGPVEPAWDREACAHCGMNVGDRHYAAQIRPAPGGRVVHFDDVGCAALWLLGHPEVDAQSAEIHVRDAQGKEWRDARSARFAAGHNTPMAYGYGVQAEGEFDWGHVAQSVQELERKRRRHGAH
jgi:nitrous oxide reductase accessory protein NosL